LVPVKVQFLFSTILGPGKVAWGVTDVQSMAVTLKQNLPSGMTQLINGDTWGGGALVQLEDTVSTARAEQIVLNHVWVKPFVERFRDRVPSGFFITDVFLFLDKIWFGKLLKPQQPFETKQHLACEEAKKIKNLMGALRGLWRSSHLV